MIDRSDPEDIAGHIIMKVADIIEDLVGDKITEMERKGIFLAHSALLCGHVASVQSDKRAAKLRNLIINFMKEDYKND
jgi:hypothetical protein